LIIFAIASVFLRWIGVSKSSRLLGIGVTWVVLTLAFSEGDEQCGPAPANLRLRLLHESDVRGKRHHQG